MKVIILTYFSRQVSESPKQNLWGGVKQWIIAKFSDKMTKKKKENKNNMKLPFFPVKNLTS